jgi:hypothetical protein
MGIPETPAEPAVSEEQAHRILALAAELDSRDGVAVPLSQLREIAQEAGISPVALDRAIDALARPRKPGLFKRLWNRLSGWLHVSPVGPLQVLTTNVLAFAGVWVLISLSTRFVSLLGGNWVITYAIAIVATLLGLGMAVRARARLTAVLLAIFAAAQLAEYPLRLLYGFGNAMPEVALMLAAGFGLLLSRFLARSPTRLSLPPAAPVESESREPPSMVRPPDDHTTLRLRPVSA